jgi:hypothetical protein
MARMSNKTTMLKALFWMACMECVSVLTYGQARDSASATLDSSTMVRKDTFAGIVTDSFFHRLGAVPMRNTKLQIPFQYIGKDSVCIARTWTNDPHYLSSYPQENLVPGKWYHLEVSFYHKDRPGYFSKMMGFYLSNGENILFKFSGTVMPDP